MSEGHNQTWTEDNFDVRGMKDPCAGSLRGHKGTHPDTIAGLASHTVFASLIPKVMACVHYALQQHISPYGLVFVCNKGRHPSVGFAHMVFQWLS
eukprot:5877068-Amphidinium_carterae.1